MKRRPRHIGLDEIQRGKGQRFWTVLSDVVHGEVIGLRQDRSEATATALLTEDLTGRATCRHHRRLHGHASAISECRRCGAGEGGDRVRQVPRAAARERSARRGPTPGVLSRGTGHAGARARQAMVAAAALEDGARIEARRAPDVVRREPAAVQSVCAARAARSPLDLQDASGRPQFPDGMDSKRCGGNGCQRWSSSATSYFKHIEGIAAYCDHPVRFGVVESINTTIKAVLRRARGMRDKEMLLLKLKWATAHPIRSARDLARFLTVQPLYSNQ